ncbi:T6SS effector amidase Tae4 family protein [Microbulbifer elongatus]|uniref:T6SS effector amidase Tae4 family protein n=1 Tax=Microbulbifer elongatus TaxID=86173 RepID=UPI001CFDD45B
MSHLSGERIKPLPLSQTHKKPKEISFTDKKGILVFEVDQWSDASGHATVWNGNACSDKCYFPISKKAYLWELKSKHSSF